MVLTEEERKKRRYKRSNDWHARNKDYILKWKADYRAGKKNISKVDRLKRNRVQYQKNRENILKRSKLRRMRPEVKAQERAYYVKHRDETRAKRLITKHKNKAKKTPGFVYFFESKTPGHYKVGYTSNWVRRRQQYSGPAAVKRLFFIRPTPDMTYAETHMKLFLLAQGHYKQTHFKSDWFIKEGELLKPT
jgi:hypothetical protein